MSTDEPHTTSNRRPAVKARFDPEVFERINCIRKERGVEWSIVVLYGIAAIEEQIPPFQEKYNKTKSDPDDDVER